MHIKKRVLIPSLVLILFLCLVFIYGYFSQFSTITNYDSYMSTPDKAFSILSHRTYTNDVLKLSLPYKEFNGYLNLKKNIAAIKLENYTVDAICFDEEQTLYLQVRKGNNKPVDLVGKFQASFDDDTLILDLELSQVGKSPLVLNSINLLNYPIDQLIIPLRTKTSNFLEAYLLETIGSDLVKDTLVITSKSRSFQFDFDFSDQVVSYKDALPLSEIPGDKATSTVIDNQKIVTYTQAGLFKEAIGSTDPALIVGLPNVTSSFYGSSDGSLFLRLKDTASDFMMDLSLELTLLSEPDSLMPNLHVASLEAVSGKTKLSELADIESTLNESIGEITAPSLGRFKIKHIETDVHSLTLTVDQTSWTIMVYMNGSDLESGYDPYNDTLAGQASQDLTEMLAGLNSDNINLIIETGGTSAWVMDEIAADTNQRFQIKNGLLNHLMDVGIQNMTAPETLIDFGKWTMDNYPSEKYALIFWDHGGGSLYGFGVDEYFPDDSLTLDEISYALDAITTAKNANFEVVGFDACLMATLETAVVLAPYSNYMIASEESEPDYGWDYERIFKQLADGSAFNGDSFGELIVSGFIDYSVEANQEELLTLSVIDLSKINKVVITMDGLITAIQSDFTTRSNSNSATSDGQDSGYASIARIIPQIKAFGGNTEDTGFTDHYDIENFAKKLTQYWPSEANKLIAALDAAVIYKASGYLATDAGGLSFYLPFYDLSLAEAIPDNYRPVSFSDTYASFLDSYIPMRLAASIENIQLDFYVDSTTRPYQLVVNPDSLAVLSDVYISVLIPYDEGDDYKYLDIGYDAWAFETEMEGVYEENFSYWPTLMDYFIPIHVTYYGDDYIEYETPIYLNGESATLVTAWIFEENRYAIFGVRRNYEEIDGIVNLNTVSLEEGDVVEMLYDVYSTQYETWNQEVQATFTVGSEPLEIVDYAFETVSYGMYFVLEDYNGEITYSDYYDIEY